MILNIHFILYVSKNDLYNLGIFKIIFIQVIQMICTFHGKSLNHFDY
jgi:hypothetical protein